MGPKFFTPFPHKITSFRVSSHHVISSMKLTQLKLEIQRQTCRQTDRKRSTERETEAYRHRDTDTLTKRHRRRDRHRDTDGGWVKQIDMQAIVRRVNSLIRFLSALFLCYSSYHSSDLKKKPQSSKTEQVWDKMLRLYIPKYKRRSIFRLYYSAV